MRITALMENTCYSPIFQKEHGLSLWIEHHHTKILFDMGQTSGFIENAALLGIDLQTADFAVLSHGHYDHGGGLSAFLEINHHAPVYHTSLAFEPHYHGEKYIGLNTGLQNHPQLVTLSESFSPKKDITIYQGQDKVPIYPIHSSGLSYQRNGQIFPEDFRHEQYLLIRSGTKRILFSGCSHRGILNIMEWFHPHVLIGGFHLKGMDPSGKDKNFLQELGSQLLSYPTRYYTCHCTGEEPYRFLKDILGDRLQYLASGATIEIPES